jgi:Iap family predicted aminopeptidase
MNDMDIAATILDKAQKENQIIYGARAINNQLRDDLKKPTKDYDIISNKPKRSAKELMEALQRKTSKVVTIEPAKHKGTYKVKIDGKTVADYTQKKGNKQTKSSWGNQYESINSIKRGINRRINKPENEFRKEKDTDALRRINLNQVIFEI